MPIVVYKSSNAEDKIILPLKIASVETTYVEASTNIKTELSKTTFDNLKDTDKEIYIKMFDTALPPIFNSSVSWSHEFKYLESFKYDLGNKMFNISLQTVTDSDIKIGEVISYTPVLVYKNETTSVVPTDTTKTFYIMAKGSTIILFKNNVTINLNWCAVDESGNELDIAYLADQLDTIYSVTTFSSTLNVYKGKTSAEGEPTQFKCLFDKISNDMLDDNGKIKYSDRFVRTSYTISSLNSTYYETDSYYELVINSYFFNRNVDIESVAQGYTYGGIKSYTTQGLQYKYNASSDTITYYFMIPVFTSKQSADTLVYLIASDETLLSSFNYTGDDIILANINADSDELMYYFSTTDKSLELRTDINDGYFDNYEYVSGTQYSTENKTGYKNVSGFTMQKLETVVSSIDGTRVTVSTGMKIGFYIRNDNKYSNIGQMYIGSPGTGQYTGIYKKTTTST